MVLSKKRIEDYILDSGYSVFRQLEFRNTNEIALISYLIEYSERFGLFTEFDQLFKLHIEKGLQLPSRLNAASKFFIGIRNIGDYSTCIDDVLCLLTKSYLEEEDSIKPVVATVLNFYSQVVYNFARQNVQGVLKFRSELMDKINTEKYSFFKNEVYFESLNIEISDNVSTYKKLQCILDKYLSRTLVYNESTQQNLLIEEGTDYANLLDSTESDFISIRNLCSSLYGKIESQTIFYSLSRGVAILEDEDQMLAYLHSYGKMHYAKMKSSIDESNLLQHVNESEIEIYDWGCGQGLASFILEEVSGIRNAKVNLIEPSEICLKRASLHLSKLDLALKINTINKDLDSLNDNDFDSDIDCMKVHLFSNILDVQFFSLENLLSLINNNFEGNNIFICVSPYINSTRTNRLNTFMEHFRGNNNFDILLNIDNKSGSWQRNWSRVIRVFKTII